MTQYHIWLTPPAELNIVFVYSVRYNKRYRLRCVIPYHLLYDILNVAHKLGVTWEIGRLLCTPWWSTNRPGRQVINARRKIRNAHAGSIGLFRGYKFVNMGDCHEMKFCHQQFIYRNSWWRCEWVSESVSEWVSQSASQSTSQLVSDCNLVKVTHALISHNKFLFCSKFWRNIHISLKDSWTSLVLEFPI